MNQVYVTVGSGSFDPLIRAVDRYFTDELIVEYQLEFSCQIGKGKFKPRLPHFRFSENFRTHFEQADVIITHGGAGTVFELLEMGKKMVVVPNQFRVDKHQQDLAWFVEKHHYGVVCWSFDKLVDCVIKAQQQTFTCYQKESFFMADDLLGFLSHD